MPSKLVIRPFSFSKNLPKTRNPGSGPAYNFLSTGMITDFFLKRKQPAEPEDIKLSETEILARNRESALKLDALRAKRVAPFLRQDASKNIAQVWSLQKDEYTGHGKPPKAVRFCFQ